jgi:thioredoxin 1
MFNNPRLTSCPLAVSLACNAEPLYDDNADAHADIRAAVAHAQRDSRAVMVTLGADGCGECKVLDASFHNGRAGP